MGLAALPHGSRGSLYLGRQGGWGRGPALGRCWVRQAGLWARVDHQDIPPGPTSGQCWAPCSGLLGMTEGTWQELGSSPTCVQSRAGVDGRRPWPFPSPGHQVSTQQPWGHAAGCNGDTSRQAVHCALLCTALGHRLAARMHREGLRSHMKSPAFYSYEDSENTRHLLTPCGRTQAWPLPGQ